MQRRLTFRVVAYKVLEFPQTFFVRKVQPADRCYGFSMGGVLLSGDANDGSVGTKLNAVTIPCNAGVL